VINYQQSRLLSLIKAHPEGIKEYDLLTLLHAQQHTELKAVMFDNLAIFQQHFVLFHALYKLNDRLQAEQTGQLIIEALNIQWLPAHAPSTQQLTLPHSDPLREYYLDITHLENTSSEDVDALLASFWVSMGDDGEKLSALALFELAEPCDLSMIKKRYRQLLAMHHPDKGGTIAMAQALNDAMTVLKRCYAVKG